VFRDVHIAEARKQVKDSSIAEADAPAATAFEKAYDSVAEGK
jgi:hypothetical protein